MTAPKKIKVSHNPNGFYVDCDALSLTTWEGEYRLVTPKREPLYWVLKEGNAYAYVGGVRGPERFLAMRFLNEEQALRVREKQGIRDTFIPTPVYRKAKP